jgi:hypothetical protein
MPTDMPKLQAAGNIEFVEESEEMMQRVDDCFAKANQAVEGHGVEKELALPPVDALEVPTQDAANSAKPVGALGEKTTPPTTDVAAPVAAKQVEAGAEEYAGLIRNSGKFEDLAGTLAPSFPCSRSDAINAYVTPE